MGADYTFHVKSIATYAPAFLTHNNSVLARVVGLCHAQPINSLSHVDLLCFHCNVTPMLSLVINHQWLPILTIVYFGQHNIKPETI